MIFINSILLLLLIAFATAAPPTAPYLGLEALQAIPDASQGRRHQGRVLHKTPDGKHLHLEYDVEHKENIILLDHVDGLNDVSCELNGVLTLSFNATPSIEVGVGSLISGGRHWLCSVDHNNVKHEELSSVILRKVVGMKKLTSNNQLILMTESAEYHEFYENAAIHFTTSAFPTNHFGVKEFEEPTQTNSNNYQSISKLKKRGLLHWIRRHWKKVQDLGRDVWHNVANIFKVAVAVFFDDFEVDKSWYQNILHVNYDPNTKRATKALTLADGHIVCDDCWAKLDLEIKFQLNVTNAHLTHFLVSATGIAQFNVDAHFAYDKEFARSHSYEWQRIKSRPIPFSIAGIPFVMQFEVPVELGYEVDIRVASRMQAKAGATGTVTYGVQYINGGLKPVAQGTWSKFGSLSKLAVQENGDAEVYVMPQVVLVVDKIGGPTAGLRAALTASADSSTPSCKSGIDAHVEFGLQVAVGAAVHIKVATVHLVDKTWGPKTLYSQQYPIRAGCVVFDGHGKFKLTSDLLIPGTSWATLSADQCGLIDGMTAQLQVLEGGEVNKEMTMALVVNGHAGAHNTSCTMQTTYAGRMASKNDATVTLYERHDADVTYEACAEYEKNLALPSSITVTLDGQLAMATLARLFGCQQVTLHKSTY